MTKMIKIELYSGKSYYNKSVWWSLRLYVIPRDPWLVVLCQVVARTQCGCYFRLARAVCIAACIHRNHSSS